MDRRYDRLLRNITVTRMGSSSFSFWEPPLDLYETLDQLIVIMDLAGIAPDKVNLTAEPKVLTIKGERKCEIDGISCVHQLEIEYGRFERKLLLPKSVDVGKITSVCKNGFLCVNMPILSKSGSVEINLNEVD